MSREFNSIPVCGMVSVEIPALEIGRVARLAIWRKIHELVKVHDDGGADWFVADDGVTTCIGSSDWVVSQDPNVAALVIASKLV